MDNSEYFSIQLPIGSRTFSLRIKRSQEKIYRDAARMVNARLQQYISMFPEQGKEDYMAMAALHIATDLIQEQNVDERLQDLTRRLNATLHLEQ